MQIRVKEDAGEAPSQLPIHDTFTLDVVWITPKRRQDIYRQAYTRRNVEVRDERADEAWSKLYTRAVIRGWRGLTLAIMEGVLKVLPVDEDRAMLAGIESERGEIPYSEDLAATLFRYALATKFQSRIVDWMQEQDDQVAIGEQTRRDRSEHSSPTSGDLFAPRAARSATD